MGASAYAATNSASDSVIARERIPAGQSCCMLDIADDVFGCLIVD
jgi:hypothetical protein